MVSERTLLKGDKKCDACVELLYCVYKVKAYGIVDIEDITWPREIRNFCSSVEKYFTSECSEGVKYFFNTRREISYLQAAI